jgi:mRNA-degrading endonuclease YafQ of YafQ-DinJ toxin-antitoxin module
MRTIERAGAFKRDFKHAKASPRHRNDVETLVSGIVALLAADLELPDNYRDHAARRLAVPPMV